MHNMLIRCSVLFFLLYPDIWAHADSPRTLVNQGNKAYLQEKYDDALSAYENALKAAPDSPVVYFNKGTAYYKKGEFDKAQDAFEQSASKTDDKHLEASARFNQGNAFYRQAEGLISSDLNGALEHIKKSIQNYREAIELDPDFKEAKENMEAGRIMMKSILEKMEEQEKQSGNKNQKQESDQDQKQGQGSEGKKPVEPDQSETKGGKPENRENSEQTQSGRRENENQHTQEKGKQENPESVGSDNERKDMSDMKNADAESILDEEKKNKERRRARIQGGFSGVDRDW